MFGQLQDLDDTVQIVEKNPAKFRIDAAELGIRKAFIQQTREEVNQMKERTNHPGQAGNSTRQLEVSCENPCQLFSHLQSFPIQFVSFLRINCVINW